MPQTANVGLWVAPGRAQLRRDPKGLQLACDQTASVAVRSALCSLQRASGKRRQMVRRTSAFTIRDGCFVPMLQHEIWTDSTEDFAR